VRRGLLLALLLLLAAGASSTAQTVSGRLFEDRDGNSLLDPSDPFLGGIPVGLFGETNGGFSFDQIVATATDGFFSFSPGNGCYLIDLPDPPGWRMSPPRWDRVPDSAPGYSLPVGEPRFAALAQGAGHLRAGALRYASMGDSIAWNFNVCSYPEQFWYGRQVRSRLACTAPAAAVTLDEAAVKGEHTDDLLVDDTSDLNNVFRIAEAGPDLITLSMIGNDLLDVDVSGTPTQVEVNRAVAEILDARRNLQEALSYVVTELPAADIAVNTLYDNLAYGCPSPATSPFHLDWVPIMDQILRDLAWGQARRVGILEVAAEFGQEGLSGTCSGFPGQICRDFFGFDRIHPNNSGYTVVREKVWEGIGGVTLGPGDALGRTAIGDVEIGFLRRVRRIHPTTWEVRNGAQVQNPGAALSGQDAGAPATITLGIGSEEFRIAGYPDWYDEIQIVKVIAGVRYRTSGSVNDDFYRMEASVTGQFDPGPGFTYAPTAWNFYTPLVGGGGPNAPAENPDYPDARLLAMPDVAAYREVSSTLSRDPVLPPGADDYEWPPLTHDDVATTAIRVVAAPVAATTGNDLYTVELDEAWLDLYGWEKPRPAEVQNVAAARLPDGKLEVSFDAIAGAQRYNLYVGRLSSLAVAYDHGAGAPAGPFCDPVTQDLGGGRLAIHLSAPEQPAEAAYILVTAHVDDVESPAGYSSAAEVDRSQSVCR
jgi:lysophospholipase L1-like esterase